MNGNLPRKGALSMLHDILSLIVAPILVGIINKLFSYWLDKSDKDNNH
jgi:hypothetical protein